MKVEFKSHPPPNSIVQEHHPVEAQTLSEYLCWRYPQQTRQWGPPLLEATSMLDGKKHSKPIYFNEDWLCAVIGKDDRLDHQIVFYVPEQRFYYKESFLGHFCQTSEGKVTVLASQLILRMAEEMEGKVDVSHLIIGMRDEIRLNHLARRCRVILAADESFFEGEHGHKRKLGNEIYDPRQEPPHKLFVQESIISAPEAILSVNEAYAAYVLFCNARGLNPVKRVSFKTLVANVINERFGITVRRDLRISCGRYFQGWKGISCRSPQCGPLVFTKVFTIDADKR